MTLINKFILFLIIYFITISSYIHFLTIYNYSFLTREINLGHYYIINVLIFFNIYFFFILDKRNFLLPSNIFVNIHFIFLILPLVFLSFIFEKLSHFYFAVIFLLIPIIFVKLLGIINFKNFSFNLKFRSKNISLSIDKFVFFLSFFSLFFFLYLSLKVGSLSFENTYSKRAYVREIIGGGNFDAYAFSIIKNFFIPLIFFYSTLKKKYFLFFIGLFLIPFPFLIFNMKNQIFLSLASSILGIFIRYKKEDNFKYLIFILIAIVTSIIKYDFFFNFVFRRIFLTPSINIKAHIDYFFNLKDDFSNSYYNSNQNVFLIFFEREGNANTNTFIYLLTNYGYLGYLFGLIIFLFIIFMLNVSFRKKNYLAIFFSFIFSIVLIEQSIYTSMLTSGFILILPLLYLIKPIYHNTHDFNNRP